MIITTKQDITTAMYMLMEQANTLLAAGKKVDVEIKEFKECRKSAQNAYYHVFCAAVAKFLDDAGVTNGRFDLPFIADDIHRINKQILGLKTTTNLSKEAFYEMCKRLMVFWQHQTNGQFTMPELPEDYLKRKGYQTL